MSQCSDKATLIKQAAVQYKLECKNTTAQKLQREIDILKMETDHLELEKKWCYDSKGERIRPYPEYEAARIAENVIQHPQLEEGVLEDLRNTRINLQIQAVVLQRQLDKSQKQVSQDGCSMKV